MEENKTNKKKYLIIGIVSVLLITILIFTLIMYNTNTSKIKRYLTKEGYECNSVECTKMVKEYQMVINVDNLYLTATNDSYIIKVNNKEILLQNRSDKSTCTYTKETYKINQLIDEDFEYTVYCQEYVSEINEVLEEYKGILSASKVKLSK